MSYELAFLLTVNPLLRLTVQGQRVASYKGSYGGLKENTPIRSGTIKDVALLV